jgi:hypothetical protein
VVIEQCRNHRKSREREAPNGPACKYGCLGKCGGIRYPNNTTRLSHGHLNIIKYTLRAIIFGL